MSFTQLNQSYLELKKKKYYPAFGKQWPWISDSIYIIISSKTAFSANWIAWVSYRFIFINDKRTPIDVNFFRAVSKQIGLNSMKCLSNINIVFGASNWQGDPRKLFFDPIFLHLCLHIGFGTHNIHLTVFWGRLLNLIHIIGQFLKWLLVYCAID